jgi:uncharacterized protein (DUF427 family)
MTSAEERRAAARARWRYIGTERPPFAHEPGPGQESVWDYPRPPRVEDDAREIVVRCGFVVVARTRRAVRVLETASPPTFYVPWSDVDRRCIEPAPGGSACEWKGDARYWTVVAGGARLRAVAWSYPAPLAGFEAIAQRVAFFPSRIECVVDGRRARPQPGGFYGGWITPEVVGPFKGEPGTQDW